MTKMVAHSASAYGHGVDSIQKNVSKWTLTTSGIFLVKYIYLDLINGPTRFMRK
jgi:hypothetical protein